MRAWALARALRARARPLRAGDADRDAPVFIVRFMCSAACLRLKVYKNNSPTGPQIVPNLSLDGSKILPKMAPKCVLEPSWSHLGGLLAMVLSSGRLFSPPVGLLERSWKPRGPKKVIGNGSWTARGHRGDRFQLA